MQLPTDAETDAVAPEPLRDAKDAHRSLAELARLVHDVISAPTLEYALTTVVRHVRKVMAVDISEVYLTDRGACEYVLLAGEGLPSRLFGAVRFGSGEGLIGRVAERAGPIALDDAATHPDYVFYEKTGEGDCHGFLGVPLTHQGLVLGVLVVRQRSGRSFQESDVAFLVTLTAQLAGAVAYAQAIASPVDTGPEGRAGAACLAGQPGAPGVAIGTVVVIFHPAALNEVPSAVYQAEAIARRVDVLSVGTNDLTQYLLAVDRTNPRVAQLLEAFHPAVLCALRDIAGAARAAGKPVACCGELAGDPASVLLLLGMGFDGLSMSVGALPRVRWVVRSFTREQMRRLAASALQCDKAESVRRLLSEALENAGLGGLVRAGK
ncbi:MAG: putative PEP-binding protein [Pseudomonadota bacterium]|nr:putative PEP-binding protein [Pseudomonadota bacterium]